MNQILITFQFVRYLMNATMDKLLRDIFIVEKKRYCAPLRFPNLQYKLAGASISDGQMARTLLPSCPRYRDDL